MAMVMRHRRNNKEPRGRLLDRFYPHRVPSMYDCIVLDDGQGEDKPKPRSGHRIVAEEGFIYCFGGYNPSANPSRFGLFPELWRYSLATRKWIPMPNTKCPEETASHSMIFLGESLMVWGGTGFPFGERCSNTLSAYHIPSKKWITVQCGGEMPTPRYGQSMTYKEGAIYVIGGTTGYNYNMKVHKLNLETLKWDEGSPPTRPNVPDSSPQPRYRHEIATSGNWIYVLGGGTAQQVFNFEIIPAYNVQTKRWETMHARPCPKEGFPLPRKFHAAVQHSNYAYLCGGFDGNATMFDDIWRLDLATLEWIKLSKTLPRPIYFHSATVTPSGCMAIFGGVISTSGDERSNEVFRIWLNVPSLQELTWELLTSKYHHIFAKHGHEDREYLRSLGLNLPPKYYKRLK